MNLRIGNLKKKGADTPSENGGNDQILGRHSFFFLERPVLFLGFDKSSLALLGGNGKSIPIFLGLLLFFLFGGHENRI